MQARLWQAALPGKCMPGAHLHIAWCRAGGSAKLLKPQAVQEPICSIQEGIKLSVSIWASWGDAEGGLLDGAGRS